MFLNRVGKQIDTDHFDSQNHAHYDASSFSLGGGYTSENYSLAKADGSRATPAPAASAPTRKARPRPAAKAFGLDDRLCLGHEHYPGDLLRPDEPSTHSSRAEDKPGWLTRFFGKKKV